MDKLRMETPDRVQENINKIAAMFPSCVTEKRGENGKLKKAINFAQLQQQLSDVVLEGDEAYEFTWVGKKASILEANTPIRKTLRPCPDESVQWDTTENLYIEGDNLEVLKLLQESYLGRVKMIYIDPPYNTGNDFIYRDNFAMGGGVNIKKLPGRSTRTAIVCSKIPTATGASTRIGAACCIRGLRWRQIYCPTTGSSSFRSMTTNRKT